MSTSDRGTYHEMWHHWWSSRNHKSEVSFDSYSTEATNTTLIPFMGAKQIDIAVTFASGPLFLNSVAELGEK